MFNAVADQLERLVSAIRTRELRLESTIGSLVDVLTRVAPSDEGARAVDVGRSETSELLVHLVDVAVAELARLRQDAAARREPTSTSSERTTSRAAVDDGLQRAFDAAPVPLLLVRRDFGTVVRCNERAASLLETRSVDLLGESLGSLCAIDGDRMKLDGCLARGGCLDREPVRLATRASNSLFCLVSAHPIVADGVDMVMIGISDVTEQKLLEARLRLMATIDPLTGALTRRRIFEVADEEVERSERYERTLCFAMLDLDHFKAINDGFGHAVGDEALRRVGRVVEATMRGSDSFGRYGGEEIALLLPETSLEDAIAVVERVRAAIEGIVLDVEGAPIGVTVSGGVVAHRRGESAALAWGRADRAMYVAKERGRNRVVGL